MSHVAHWTPGAELSETFGRVKLRLITVRGNEVTNGMSRSGTANRR